MNTFKRGDRVKFTVAGSPEYVGTVIAEHERDASEVLWDDGKYSMHLPDALTRLAT